VITTTDEELRDAINAAISAWDSFGFTLNGHARLEKAMEVLKQVAANEQTNWGHDEPCL
jgi:hypothetical protein